MQGNKEIAEKNTFEHRVQDLPRGKEFLELRDQLLEDVRDERAPEWFDDILERYIRGDGAERIALYMSFRDLRQLFTLLEKILRQSA